MTSKSGGPRISMGTRRGEAVSYEGPCGRRCEVLLRPRLSVESDMPSKRVNKQLIRIELKRVEQLYDGQQQLTSMLPGQGGVAATQQLTELLARYNRRES